MSDLGNETLKSADSTLMQVAEAVLSGATLRIRVPLHNDGKIVPDSLLQEPHVTEIVEALRDPKPDLKEYVRRHLFPVADRYRVAANYLQEKHNLDPGSDKYEEWLAILAGQMDQYFQSEYSQFKNVDYEGWRIGGPVQVTDPELEDKDILAAVAVIGSANQIADRLELSNRSVSCNLDAVVQLAELHSFCDASFKFWESEKTKEDGWTEKLSRNRQTGHKQGRQARQEIRNKLSRLIDGKEPSRYFYNDGQRSGRPKIDYIRRAIEQEFESDQTWNRKTPGKSVMREEIRNFFCANQ